ncbi:hypothetical protein ACIPYS_02605 [Kitasatospora sp. NPDC089913]|uniref:hypothetical protein n=1 Tax=Kitasatospora sp. NPDC089913 TaxID=3364080 RepID=UPI00381397B0
MLRRLPTAALLLAVLSVLAAVPGEPSRAPAAAPAVPEQAVPEQADAPPLTAEVMDRARRVAEAWPGSEAERIWRTGYYPALGGETWLPEDFTSDDGAFAAFLDGRIDLAADFPPFSGTGTVSFPDGTSTALPLTDPRTVYEDRIRYRDGCRNEPCDTRLTVTAVRPSTRRQRTSRGTVTAPVWEFVFAGLDHPYAVAAVQSQAPFIDYSVEDADLPAGVTDVVLASEEEQWLEGMVRPENCADARPGEVYATADVLVLIGRTTGRPRTCPEPSNAQYPRFAFTRPLGDRVVLNLAGRPVLFPELVPEG